MKNNSKVFFRNEIYIKGNSNPNDKYVLSEKAL